MLLHHATLARNLPSILRRGLLCAKSQGRRQVVWLHSAAASGWALLHAVKRHGGRVEGVAIVEAAVPRAWLRRNRRGLWYSVRDVPAERLRRFVTFAELAGAVAPRAGLGGAD
jgi:hypothetical protein